VFAINHNADNALTTLRYRFPKVDFQVAEEGFEAGASGSGAARSSSAAFPPPTSTRP
jgi:hypothetical protein